MHKAALAALAVVALLGCGAPSWAQDDRTVREMALLITLKEYDLSCRRLDAAARKRFEAFATLKIEESALTPKQKDEVLEAWRTVTPTAEFNCRGDNALFDTGLAIFADDRSVYPEPPASRAAGEVGL